MQMHIGESGFNLVKGFEGLRMRAHYAPTEQWTVGYGHTDSARHGMAVSEKEADRLLEEDMERVEQAIRDCVMTPINQNEFDALASFVFNIGIENFRSSLVLRRLNSGDHLGAAEAMEYWNKAEIDGELVTLDGLVRRRAAEKSLFLMPPTSDFVVPSAEVAPSRSCEEGVAQTSSLNAVPIIHMSGPSGGDMSDEETEARMRALFAATQAIAGDPSKMIISRAEEKADFGVTAGAFLAGLSGFAIALLGAVILFGLEAPGLAEAMGLSENRLYDLFEHLPLWLVGLGVAVVYFVLYVILKRTVRHELKLRRAEELSRFAPVET